jgi:predicted nuclease of predicted toxin-antitoxin system
LSVGRPDLLVFLDAGVPDSVGAAFIAASHAVIFHRDMLPDKTPDPVVCATALRNKATLVAIDTDMKQFPRRFGISRGNDRFAGLSIIRICCNEVLASKRVAQAMTFIEHEWSCTDKAARRLWVEIGSHHLRTNR